MTGTIKALRDDRLYGFIKADDGGLDFFFHESDLSPGLAFEELRNGDSLAFDAMTPAPQKGPRATNIMLIKTADVEAAAS